jgi:type VI secretion system secreted protein VgrG
MHHITRSAAGILATVALLSAAPLSASASTSAHLLGGAAKFVVLGGAGVTCTKSTIGLGAVGSKLTVTKTTTCSIAGAVHQGDATAVAAFNNFSTAYAALKAKTCPPANNLSGQALGGKTLAPGVYCFSSSAGLTNGILTLAGPSSGVWVIQVGTSLTTAASQVVMAGGGKGCNVYWAPGTTATIGTGSKFQGNILAGSAVTFSGTGSSLVGRALAKTAVTMTGANLRLPSDWNTSICH